MDTLFTLRIPTHKGMVIIKAFDGGRFNNRSDLSSGGSTRIDVEVKLKGKVIFKPGDIWCGTPATGTMSIDGNEAKELVLSLVAMKVGDTDREYFDNYTQEQLDFSNALGDELNMVREYRYCDEDGNPKK